MLPMIVLAGLAGGAGFRLGLTALKASHRDPLRFRATAGEGWWAVAGAAVVTALFAWLVGYLSVVSRTVDREYWTGYVTETYYREGWTETRVVIVTDAKGRSHPETRTTHHLPEWWLRDTNGQWTGIGSDDYRDIAIRFGVKKPATGGWGGTKHECRWDGRPETAYVWVTVHRFKNPTLAGGSLFSFRDYSKAEVKELGLPDWDNWQWHPAGPADPFGGKLGVLNADYGKAHKVRVHFVFVSGKGADWGHAVEEHWKRGKKNELTCVVGIGDGATVDWCHTFGWSDAEAVKAGLREHVAGMAKFDPDSALDWLRREIPDRWSVADLKRYDHVAVRVPAWLTILIVLTMFGGGILGGRQIQQAD